MARVTVEDCLNFVKNRFDLVIKASKRARQLELGEADSLVPLQNDKMTVVALREIAAGFDITKAQLRHNQNTTTINHRSTSTTQTTIHEKENQN